MAIKLLQHLVSQFLDLYYVHLLCVLYALLVLGEFVLFMLYALLVLGEFVLFIFDVLLVLGEFKFELSDLFFLGLCAFFPFA